MMKENRVLIIGSGLAAITVAMKLAGNKQVTLLTKGELSENNSIRAQGGVAVAVDSKDSWRHHFQDTMDAGYNLPDAKAVTTLVKKGPSYIQQLIDIGFLFDRDKKGQLLLGHEGAHSNRRILHAGGDRTGKQLMSFLTKKLPENVQIVTNHTVIDLIVLHNRCYGVKAINNQGEVIRIYAEHVVLATGGCGGLYQVSSNDPSITGDGIAIGYRAGARLTDLEFMQFHPTLLVNNKKSYGLISEAVRGEGARLVTEDGEAIMANVHPLKDLAPRDVVARTLQALITNGEKVYLDISMITQFSERFPGISAICDQAGIELERGWIPVAPGAHFIMGGISTNLAGETSVKCLYAVGEVAATGVHGANRLASNSLLEAIVFANRVANSIRRHKVMPCSLSALQTSDKQAKKRIELPMIAELQARMTREAGIIRDQAGLLGLKQWLESFDLEQDVTTIDPNQFKAYNQMVACWLIVTSALARTESRGAHWRRDYPEQERSWEQKHVIRERFQFARQNIPGGDR